MHDGFAIQLVTATMSDKHKKYVFEVSDNSGKHKYSIYDFDWESNEREGISPLSLMDDWLSRSKILPAEHNLVLANGGKTPVADIDSFLVAKKQVSDLVRTNVTIAAPLFEWAKSRANKEGTSFSDLVSRGLLALKDSNKVVDTWFLEQSKYFHKKLGNYGSFEVSHYLPNSYENYSVEILKQAMENSEQKKTGWPIGVYLNNSDVRPVPQEDGIKAEYVNTSSLLLDYWYVKNNGDFYFARNLESDSGNGNAEPNTCLYFDTLVWRVAESLEHCISLYENLKIVSNTRVKVKISIGSLNGRFLSAWNTMRAFTLRHYVCNSDKASWEVELPLNELRSNLDDLTYEACKKMLVMFDFFVPNKEVVNSILEKEYRKSSY